jgi:hypothetical protein
VANRLAAFDDLTSRRIFLLTSKSLGLFAAGLDWTAQYSERKYFICLFLKVVLSWPSKCYQ